MKKSTNHITSPFMSVTIQAGSNGREMNLSNANFNWLMTSLGISVIADTHALLPSSVITAIKTFNQRTAGYYTDEDLVARIFEYLAPVTCPQTQAVIACLAGAKIVDGSNVNWGNLGRLGDLDSDANHLWSKLRGYVRELKWLAQVAQKQGDVLRLY